MSKHRFTLSNNPEAEKCISGLLDQIAKVVQKNIADNKLRSLILLGGYGKGEGGVSVVGNSYKPHNNFDLLLVTQHLSKTKQERVNEALSQQLQALAGKLDIGIDLSLIDQWKLKNMPTRVLWYDMMEGHRTLLGDAKFVPSIKHKQRDIPAWDMRNLMVNRGSLLLLNQICLQNEERSQELDRLIIKHAMKAIIGYGDALLYSLDEYHWSYREKHARILKHSEIDLRFKRLYDEALSFRLSPKYAYYLQLDLKDWHRNVMRQLESIHLKCEAKRLQRSDLTWQTYFDTALVHSLYEREFNAKECLRRLMNLIKPKTGKLPNKLPPLGKLAYQLSDNESMLPLIFPYIAFNPSFVNSSVEKQHFVSFFSSHFGRQEQDSLLSIIKAYVRQWGATFDRNLSAVLSKNQIAL
ncbi:hypothetical protein A3767_01845 [Oleiphilus sp. HI0133]|nr:hypothetical protein A3767_17785 [Oleiphilus sp. HI0133]KZZ78942.1 hypothetical protein A3767_01845 [Oleiphilus sp. HI0133]